MSGKRAAALLLAMLLLAGIMLMPEAAYADESAKELTRGAKITSVDDPEGLANLTDGKTATRYICAAGTRVKVECEEPVSQIYIIIDRPVDGYQLKYNGKTLQCGQNGFLHEYIALEEPAKELEFTFTAEKTSVCELYLFGAGDAPEWVQKWTLPYDDADILVMPTHADDEHLWFGGTMPYYGGELGYKVQVAYMTNHWGERYRPHELLNGLWKVGITAYPVISDFVDAYSETLKDAENFYGREKILEWQVMLLRRFKPEVVVGHDLEGEYGHGAHRLNASTLLEAAPLAADASSFPESVEKYGTWELPKLYLHLYPENQIVMDWSMSLERFGGKTALEMAKEGYLEHVSQQAYWFEVKDTGKYACTRFGLAYTTVGEDDAEKHDFLQNITHFSDEYDIIEESEESMETSAEEQSSPEESVQEEPEEPPAEQSTEEKPEKSGKNGASPLVILLTGAVVLVIVAALMLQIHFDRKAGKKAR